MAFDDFLELTIARWVAEALWDARDEFETWDEYADWLVHLIDAHRRPKETLEVESGHNG